MRRFSSILFLAATHARALVMTALFAATVVFATTARAAPSPAPPSLDFAELNARILVDRDTLVIDNATVTILGQPARVSARIPLRQTPSLDNTSLDLELPDTDIAILAPHSENILAPQGRLSLTLSVAPGKPPAGRVTIRDAALRPIPGFVRVTAIDLDADLRDHRFEITRASAIAGTQPVALAGHIDLAETALASLIAAAAPSTANRKSQTANSGGGLAGALRPNITLRAANIPLVRNAGFILRGDFDLRIETPPDAPAPRVTGAITLRDSLFLSNIRDLWASRPASGPASRPPFFAIGAAPFNDWPLNIAVRGDRFMRVRSTAFNALLSAAFRVEGTLGEPRATGDATIDSGNVVFPFATFVAQSGRARLAQASPFMPEIEFAAATRALGYDLTLNIHGTASRPVLAFASSPALTSEQIILFIMAGEAPNSEYSAPAQQRALSLGVYFGQTLLNELFNIAPGEDRLTLASGERLTRLGRETYSIAYKLTDRLSAIGEYDEFDSYNIGLKILVYRSRPAAGAAAVHSSQFTVHGLQAADENPKASMHKLARERQTVNREPGTVNPGGEAAAATITVAGQGWWTNLQHRRLLQRTLSLDKRHAPVLTANEIEDAALILLSQLAATGHLHPKLEITLTPAAAGAAAVHGSQFTVHSLQAADENPKASIQELARERQTVNREPGFDRSDRLDTVNNGSPAAAATFTATNDNDFTLPRDTTATRARIRVHAGKRYELAEVTFTGLRALTAAEARAFFIPPGGLLERNAPPYTPDAFKRATTALLDTLRHAGRAEAAATLTALNIDDTTGRVTASLAITEGPIWKIHTLATELTAEGRARSPGAPQEPQTSQEPPDNRHTGGLGETALPAETTAASNNPEPELRTLNAELTRAFASRPWSQWTQQDIAERVRQHYFRLGHPDVRVQVTATATADAAAQTDMGAQASRLPTKQQAGRLRSHVPSQDTIPAAVHIQITPGPQVRLGAITYAGNRHTRDTFIRRRIKQRPGDLLDPIALETTRHRLSALGAFRSVDLAYADSAATPTVAQASEPAPAIPPAPPPAQSTNPNPTAEPPISKSSETTPVRPSNGQTWQSALPPGATTANDNPQSAIHNPQFRAALLTLVERPLTDISLLAGYGSYEQLRGGVEAGRLNLLGIGDQTRLLLVQSMKSTRGDLTLAVPDLAASGVNGALRAFGLRRDEAAFKRIEYGGNLTFRRAWGRRGLEAIAGYSYEYLNSSRDTLSPGAGDTSLTIAATLNLMLARDRRDNPLYPKRGYNWFLQAELAGRRLGGRADYQRYRAGASYHTSWGGARWLHFGLSQDLVMPLGGGPSSGLPVNKLFYPGGDNSIRGYREGGAAPRDGNGAYLGAKACTLLSAEIEQSLLKNVNAVVFYDLLCAVANTGAVRARWLNSAGVGLRYHTLLGPVRLEYGRNLNPRPRDPRGTLLLSIGMPF